jgi:hypothetical protein
MTYLWAKRKLNKKIKRRHGLNSVVVGVSSLSKAGRRLTLLDKALTLFGMRIGAYQTADLDVQGDRIVSVRLTVYFTEVTKR